MKYGADAGSGIDEFGYWVLGSVSGCLAVGFGRNEDWTITILSVGGCHTSALNGSCSGSLTHLTLPPTYLSP